ncbi:MAG: hypothetical protein IT422_13050 [Pirellulaceae bacterium]|nr:hypothetical protein [Pirellulaceae bacterium]
MTQGHELRLLAIGEQERKEPLAHEDSDSPSRRRYFSMMSLGLRRYSTMALAHPLVHWQSLCPQTDCHRARSYDRSNWHYHHQN